VIDELDDLALEIDNGSERTAPDCAVCDQCEPAFDLIEPRAVGMPHI